MKETKKNGNFISYEKLLKNYLWCRDFTLSWLKDEGLIARSRICTNCGSEMKRFQRGDRSVGYVWECRKQLNGKLHKYERSIPEGSWLKKRTSQLKRCWNLHTGGVKTWPSANIIAGWPWLAQSSWLGYVLPWSLWGGFARWKGENWGAGKLVQIDESKIGKRKYHLGHVVEG